MKNLDEIKNKINSRHNGLYNNLIKKITTYIKLVICLLVIVTLPQNLYAAQLDSKGTDFWLMFDGGTLIAFVDGMVTDRTDLTDDLYADAALHDAHGAWQMIFGVNTLPEYRRHGYAGQLLRRAVADARQQGRKGLVLTCKERLLPYYAKFGFQDEGVTDKSTHGNVAWHQMRLSF